MSYLVASTSQRRALRRHARPVQLAAALGVILLGLLGCDDDTPAGGSLAVFIVDTVPNPPTGHAPVEMTFEVDFPRGEREASEFEIVWDFGDGATVRDQIRPVHTYVSAGIYDVTVTVTDPDTGATGTNLETVTVLESAELSVSGVQARPGEVVAGQNLQVLYSLRNEGVDVELPFGAVVFLTTDPAPDADDLSEFSVLDTDRFERMPGNGASGSVVDFNGDLRVPESVASGDYYVGVLIDADQEIGELDEDNNIQVTDQTVRIKNPSTDGPDLVAVDVAATPRRTRILSSASLDFDIENRGPATALGFSYGVYLSPDEVFDEDRDTFLMEAEVEGLTRGGTREIRDVLVPINPAITEPGAYYLIVVMDPGGELTEIDEGNNVTVAQAPIRVTDEPILDADIVVTDFRVDPASTYLGGSFTASIDLTNQGSQPTGSFICSIYLSEDQVLRIDEDLVTSSVNVFDLAGDASTTQEAIVSVPAFYAAGSYWAFVYCDASGVVVEFDEDNNVQRFIDQVNVAVSAQIDVSVANVAVDPPSPIQSGTPVTVSFEACNNGSTGSSPSLMRVLLSRDTAVDSSDRIAFEGTLPGFGPGQCQTVEVEIDGSCANWQENYQLLVVADVRDLLDETNEDNNKASLNGGLTIQGEFCSCTSDASEPNNFPGAPAALSAGSTTGLSLCNGDADWYAVSLAANDSLRVTMTHDPSRGELDVILLDPSRTPLERSGSGGDGTEIVDTWLVPAAGDYLVQVAAASPGEINLYDLDIEIIGPKTGSVDLAAVDVRPSDTAPALNTPWDVALALVNLGDQAAGSDVRVTLYLTQDAVVDPAIDVELDQFTVSAPAGLTRLDVARQVIIPGDTTSGFWRIGAAADTLDAVAESDETNNASVSSPFVVDTTCFDVLEPNDSQSAAVDIEPQDMTPPSAPNFTNLVVCKSNPDFYRIHVESGKQLSITVTGDDQAGDFDIVLRNAAGDELASSRTSNETETIVVPLVVGEQDWFLEVLQLPSSFNLDRSGYELTVVMVDADPSLVCNATFEPNNSFATAASLIDAAATPQTIATCPETDQDYYRINLAAGSSIDVGLTTTSTKLRAQLYDANRLPVAGTTIFNPASDRIVYTAPFAGTYTVRVYPSAGAARSIEYGLDLTGLDGVDLAPGDLSLAPTTLAPGEPVQFNVLVDNPGTLDSATFDVDIVLSTDSLIDGSDTVLATLSGVGPVTTQSALPLSGKVDLPQTLVGGSYFIGVLVDPSDAVAELDEFNNDVSGAINVVAACQPDAYEAAGDNNAPARATDLAAEAPVDATICSGDLDWYTLATTPGQMVTLTAMFTHATGDLDLYVYDQSLMRIGDGRSLTDNETVTVTSAAGGPIFIEVRGFTSAVSNSYTLDFQ